MYSLLSSCPTAGCAAKIRSSTLNNILEKAGLLTYGRNKEDAYSFSISPMGTFFQSVDIIAPVVDDPFAFGQIASSHALSDIYAMGAKPITAMSICSFPKDLPEEIAIEILKGSKQLLDEEYVMMLGGHTVSDNLKYGLSVTGTASDLGIYNSGLKNGDILILTKPLGTGILTNYLKQENNRDIEETLINSCTKTNKIGMLLHKNFRIHTMTDISGFGLIGHLSELLMASDPNIGVEIFKIPCLDGVKDVIKYSSQSIRIKQNFEDYRSFITGGIKDIIIFDPQTSGGLLIGVSKDILESVVSFIRKNGDSCYIIGRVVKGSKIKVL